MTDKWIKRRAEETMAEYDAMPKAVRDLLKEYGPSERQGCPHSLQADKAKVWLEENRQYNQKMMLQPEYKPRPLVFKP